MSTVGTGFGSSPTEGAGLGSLPTEGTGDGAADGSPGALGTGDGSADGSAVGSAGSSAGTEGTGDGSAAAVDAAAVDAADESPETVASALVHAVARSTTTRALPAAATTRAAVPQGARRPRGESMFGRKGMFDRWRVTKRSVSADARPMTGPGCDVGYTTPTSILGPSSTGVPGPAS